MKFCVIVDGSNAWTVEAESAQDAVIKTMEMAKKHGQFSAKNIEIHHLIPLKEE